MGDMTREEFLEKYGDVKVQFVYYRKYKFVFEGYVGEDQLVIEVGGTAPEIYDLEVMRNEPLEICWTVRDLEPYFGHCGEDRFCESTGIW